MKIEVYTDRSGQTRFRIKADNGEVIVPVEAYRRKASALKTVRVMQAGLADAEVVMLDKEPGDLTKYERELLELETADTITFLPGGKVVTTTKKKPRPYARS